MKILVPVKRVIDPYVKIRFKSDASGVETSQMKMVMNPFDEIALEEAIRLMERGQASEVLVLSIGPAEVTETLRQGLALGATRAIHVEAPNDLDSYQLALIIKEQVLAEDVSMVLMGKQAIDSDANQTPQMLAACLAWPQACYISSLDCRGEDLQVLRETDAGLEQLELSLPAILSVDLRLNEPRYASLPNIMKAKSKPLEHKTWSPSTSVLQTISVTAPKMREKGVVLDSVDELLEKIKPMISA